MIQVAPGTKVHLACRPVSMRYGFDGLSAKVASVLSYGRIWGMRWEAAYPR
jgi:transposase